MSVAQRIDPISAIQSLTKRVRALELLRGTSSGAGTWVTATLLNSWVAFGGSEATPAYQKTADGIVRLRGAVKSGSSATATVMTLPVGYRPPANWRTVVLVNAGTLCYVRVQSDGTVNFTFGGDTSGTWLDGIEFSTLT